MDDETLAYKAYQKFANAGIRNVAVHKGLFTRSDEKNFPRLDLHTHFIRDDAGPGLQYFANLRERMRKKRENPELPNRPATLNDLHLGTYVRELWFDTDTKIAALSGAPSDVKKDWLLPNVIVACNASRGITNVGLKSAGHSRPNSAARHRPGDAGTGRSVPPAGGRMLS